LVRGYVVCSSPWLVAWDSRAVAGTHDAGMDAPSERDGAEQTTSSQQGCTAHRLLLVARAGRAAWLTGITRAATGKRKGIMVDSLQRRKVHGTLVLVKSYCREGTAHQEKAGGAEMKGYRPSSGRMRPGRRGRGAGWRTQILLAMLLGAGGGVAAARITRHPASAPAVSLTQPDASSHAHTPAVPYATAAALLTHFPSAHTRKMVRLRDGNLLLVIEPVSRQRQATPALPTHPHDPRKSITP